MYFDLLYFSLKEFNLNLGEKIEAEKKKVAYVVIKHIRPKALSRIDGVKVESIA